MSHTVSQQPIIRLGVSACLLGERVRHDGGHKHDRYLSDVLGRFVEWVPVCPEVELGLGVPRPTIRLEGAPDAPRLVEPKAGRDLTRAMDRYARRRVRELEALRLHGFVCKSKSPSCGRAGLPVYGAAGRASRRGRGRFTAALMDRMPLVPVEDEARLHDAPIREHFLERVFAYQRWTALLDSNPARADVAAFHACHTLALRSHAPAHAARLGRLVAGADAMPRARLVREYGAGFMAALATRATPGQHAEVLYRVLRLLKNALTPEDEAELTAAIADFRQGRAPLVVPLTLARHHVRRHPANGMAEQTYLNPAPAELLLRNHA